MAGKEESPPGKSPAALGPYSEAAAPATSSTCPDSGLKAETMEFAGDTIEEQTEQVMSNVGEILKEAGADFKDVVKTTILLADMRRFQDCQRNLRQALPREPSRARATCGGQNAPPQRPRRDRLHRLPPRSRRPAHEHEVSRA